MTEEEIISAWHEIFSDQEKYAAWLEHRRPMRRRTAYSERETLPIRTLWGEQPKAPADTGKVLPPEDQ